MRPKKLPFIICNTAADIKYRSVKELGLNKANSDKTNISNLRLGDILCHNCYMKTIEWNRYEKKKSRVKIQLKYDDFTYQTKINRVTMSQKKYENLSEK
ncbi:617_t:CDS:1, partial [Funneliformis mosseae]